MKQGYGQSCPLALAADCLGERWTLLIVSRLIDGCRRFNEIHRGVPRISATLLSTRLDQLITAGLCEKRPIPTGHGYEYVPTEACEELEPIVMDLAAWGQRWARDMENDDLDTAFLAWSMSTRLDTAAMPAGRTVVEFEFSGLSNEFNRFWLVNDNGAVDMCLRNPGFDVDVVVRADIRNFIECWRGFRSVHTEMAKGRIRVEGSRDSVRNLRRWLLGSALAGEPRRKPGLERNTHRRTIRRQVAGSAESRRRRSNGV